MSATSGNATLSLAGTATYDRIGVQVTGVDTTTPTTQVAANSAVAVTNSFPAAIAGTGTAMQVSIKGIIRVTATGTVIPSIALTTANAAIAKAGSYFKCARIGDSADTFIGAWS
jgi:hypothetical protein